MTKLTELVSLALPVGLIMGLTACGGGSVGAILGVDQTRTPDEFAVVKRAPLTLPPSFELRPPDPNGQRNQDTVARVTAEVAVFGDDNAQLNQTAEAQNLSSGEAALLQATGADQASPEIRQQIDEEVKGLTTVQASLLEDLMFWQNKGDTSVQLVDPYAESKRLQENAALGQQITTGNTPTISRDSEDAFFDWF